MHDFHTLPVEEFVVQVEGKDVDSSRDFDSMDKLFTSEIDKRRCAGGSVADVRLIAVVATGE